MTIKETSDGAWIVVDSSGAILAGPFALLTLLGCDRRNSRRLSIQQMHSGHLPEWLEASTSSPSNRDT